MVGATGFEPVTTRTPSVCATRLRYAPTAVLSCRKCNITPWLNQFRRPHQDREQQISCSFALCDLVDSSMRGHRVRRKRNVGSHCQFDLSTVYLRISSAVREYPLTENNNDDMKLLEGVRVLDLTNVLAGPFCCYQLAQLGADVIKVEVPRSGDLARQLGADPELNKRLMGASFLAQNAGKRSVTINLKSPAGKEVFHRLVATADVVVENFRPGVMDRLGLGYEALRKSQS